MPSSAAKKRKPFETTGRKGTRSAENPPGAMSATRRVPSAVPSLSQSSRPCVPSSAAKKTRSPAATSPWGDEAGAGLEIAHHAGPRRRAVGHPARRRAPDPAGEEQPVSRRGELQPEVEAGAGGSIAASRVGARRAGRPGRARAPPAGGGEVERAAESVELAAPVSGNARRVPAGVPSVCQISASRSRDRSGRRPCRRPGRAGRRRGAGGSCGPP